MKKIGLVIELKAGELKPANFGLISAARDKEHELCALLLEPLTPEIRQHLSHYGVHRIIAIKIPDGTWNPDQWARAISAAASSLSLDALAGLTTAQGKDLLPRIAAILDAPLVMDCIEVDFQQQVVRTSQYSGKTVASLQLTGATPVYGLRPNSVAAVADPREAQVSELDLPMAQGVGLEMISVQKSDGEEQNLSEADVIISGGRGMKNGENFKLLRDCARHIEGAAVGASRVAVDEGWVPYTMQVGQTGTKVNPKVYVACGISGSIQHFAGMKTSGMIIAINTDPEAAMMANCDYFVEADLFEVLPELAKQLKAERDE